ncbi:MAG: NADH-quinone oxidoreductase subunit H, partial [Myxococcaceae bacterium]|nr:NADH-quinone oxidoreductase subunit H [Myxococcaceae bacterium]
MRLGVVFTGIGLIVGGLFGVMLAAYALGAIVEGFLFEKAGIHGGGHIVQVVLMMLVVVMVIATLLTLAERKWSAFMQDRMGPNRARIGLPVIKNMSLAGLPHIATDVLKMLTKEAFRPATANRVLFNLAPMLAFAPAFALFAVVPSGPTLDISLLGYTSRVVMSPTNPDAGLLFLFAIASLAVYGTSLAGWSSNNKFALLGGVRASSQMVSYEVALGLSLVGMMAAFST